MIDKIQVLEGFTVKIQVLERLTNENNKILTDNIQALEKPTNENKKNT